MKSTIAPGDSGASVESNLPAEALTPQATAGIHQDNAGSSGVEDCTWADVLNSMQDATSEYREKSDSSRVRAAQRDKAIAVTLLSLTDMIPEQDGLSILRGGMSTIFKVI